MSLGHTGFDEGWGRAIEEARELVAEGARELVAEGAWEFVRDGAREFVRDGAREPPAAPDDDTARRVPDGAPRKVSEGGI